MAQFLRWRLQELTASRSKDPAGTVKNHLNALRRSAATDYTPASLRSLYHRANCLLLPAGCARCSEASQPGTFTDGGKARLRLLQDEGHEATKRARL